MARFGGLATQYFDSNGDPLSNGVIYFYEPGTTTDKTVYSDAALTTAHTQPVSLDADGYQPNIFFDGEAKAVLYTAAIGSGGTLVSTADPIGEGAGDSGIKDWSSSATYDLDDVVKGSDGYHYQSVQGANNGNNPTTPSPSWWMRLDWISVWNTNYTYAIDALVSYDDEIWMSLQGSNQGNTPAYSSNHWKAINRELRTSYAIRTTNYNMASGSLALINTSGGAFEGTLPSNPIQGDRVAAVDVAGSWADENFTIGQAGTGEKIMGLSEDLVCDKTYAAVYLEYTGTTYGWILI
jgi:hypothetical protein